MADPVISVAIWERYERDRPRPGREFNEWVVKLSSESGFSEAIVRNVVGQGASQMLNAISDRLQTTAQQLADIIGSDLAAALGTLRDAYTATKKKVLLDKAGRPQLVDEMAGFTPENMIYVEVPDWHARLGAVRTTIEIYGARAPQQIEVNQHTTTLDLTPQHALAELSRLADAIPRLQAALADESKAASGSTRRRAAIEGTTGDPRPLFLADGMHPDKGRAGPERPV